MPRIGSLLIGVGIAVATMGVVHGSSVGAATNPVEYTADNVTTCAQIGFAGALQYDGNTKTSVTNTAYFTATVTSDKYVTISNIAPGVTILGAAIKAGNNYHVYNPILANMQAPLNGGGQIPDLSHWFLCYTYTPPSTTVATTTPTTIVTTIATTTPTTIVETTAPTTTPTTIVETTAPTTTPTTIVETTAPTTTPTTIVETTVAETTTTELGSEGPTTTVVETTDPGQTTTTELGSEGPTTTLLSGGGGGLPQTGSGDVSGSLVLLGLFLVGAGAVITALARRTLAD